jgi:tRNA modification GTPase
MNASTIIACCTPPVTGALALIRISGPQALTITQKFTRLSKNKNITQALSHTILHGHVINTNTITDIDDVLLLIMHGPKTFTGYDTVEITCHGNLHIVQEIITQACCHGARKAQAGEFTRQAYENKKIDLLQAEAIADLIHAQTITARTAALAQLRGSLSETMNTIHNQLVTIAAWGQAELEFLDTQEDFSPQIQELTKKLLQNINKLLQDYDQNKQLRNGITIALIGPVNAGKSSLFNTLVGYNRAIVTPIPGTTRDTIHASINHQGNTITFIDTAGLRTTNDVIEQEGMKRSLEEIEQADIVVIVLDQSRVLTRQEQETFSEILHHNHTKSILVYNKADLPTKLKSVPQGTLYPVPISTVNKQGFEQLWHHIDQHISQLLSNTSTTWLINQRHYGHLLTLKNQLLTILDLLDQQTSTEILVYHIEQALNELSDMTGTTVNQQIMDTVFKTFCVGK